MQPYVRESYFLIWCFFFDIHPNVEVNRIYLRSLFCDRILNMTANAITISSRLEAAGLEKKTADAVASELVEFNDEKSATKADIAELKAELKADIVRIETKMDTKFNIVIALISAVFIALVMGRLLG